MPEPTLGQIAYEAYCQHQQWKNYQGSALPPWQDNRRQDIRDAWEAAADAVRARVLHDLVTGGAQATQERQARQEEEQPRG